MNGDLLAMDFINEALYQVLSIPDEVWIAIGVGLIILCIISLLKKVVYAAISVCLIGAMLLGSVYFLQQQDTGIAFSDNNFIIKVSGNEIVVSPDDTQSVEIEPVISESTGDVLRYIFTINYTEESGIESSGVSGPEMIKAFVEKYCETSGIEVSYLDPITDTELAEQQALASTQES